MDLRAEFSLLAARSFKMASASFLLDSALWSSSTVIESKLELDPNTFLNFDFFRSIGGASALRLSSASGGHRRLKH